MWDVLIELEQITNPRVRDEAGEISLVPPERRVSGRNATYVMAPFTHVNPKGSRFSDGIFGVYYAANRLKTAIAETTYHFARFAMDAKDPPRREDMRVLVGSISDTFHDVQTMSPSDRVAILDHISYDASRSLGLALRQAGSNGIIYPSVRDSSGRCIGAFWPNVVGIPVQERHLQYDWDGDRISRYFDFSLGEWFPL